MNDISIERAFKAPFDDSEWIGKTLLGLLWGLLIVTIPALYGAQLDYIRGVAGGDDRLPSWSDFGDKWVRGLLLSLASLLYFAPVIVGGAFVFIPALITASVRQGSDAAAGAFLGSICIYSIASIVYFVVVSLFFSAATVNYAMKGNFGALFEFGEIIARVRSGNGYWTAWLYSLALSLGAGLVASLLSATGVGGVMTPAVSYLMTMMSGHLFGRWAAREYVRV